jgi:hypothetical protein
MDGYFWLVIAIIIAIVIAVIIILIVAGTSSRIVYRPTSGRNSKGSWKTIGTAAGPLPSYFFVGTLLNQNLQYWEGDFSLGSQPFIWEFDGLFLSNNNGYVSISGDNQLTYTNLPETAFLFDAYNFYVTLDLTLPSVRYIDSLTGKLSLINNPELYIPTIGWEINGA